MFKNAILIVSEVSNLKLVNFSSIFNLKLLAIYLKIIIQVP